MHGGNIISMTLSKNKITQKKWHRGGIIDLFQIFSQFIHSIWDYSTYWWDKFCISFSSPRKKAKKSESDSHRTVSNHITILLNQRNDSSLLLLIEKSDFRCNLLLYKSSTTWKSHIEVYFFTSPSSEKKKFWLSLIYHDIYALHVFHISLRITAWTSISIYSRYGPAVRRVRGEALRGVRSRVGYTSEFIRRCVRSDIGPFRWLLVGDNLVTPR